MCLGAEIPELGGGGGRLTSGLVLQMFAPVYKGADIKAPTLK